jgi:hypothetical protein
MRGIGRVSNGFHDHKIRLVPEKDDGPSTTQEHHLSKLELIARALQRLEGQRPD